MRVLHISHSNGGGGADIAAYRIHRALVDAGVDSLMAVAHPVTADDPTVVRLPQRGGLGREWARDHLGELALWTQKSSNGAHRSLNAIDSGALGFLATINPSVINLHWMGSDTMSIAEIGEVARRWPVVWTLHDAWAFTGAEHLPEDMDDRRYAANYSRASRRPGNTRFDLDAAVYRRKRHCWTAPIFLTAVSSFMADMAHQSTLAASWPCEVIPNPLDVTTFRPLDANDRASVRSSFGLPADAPLVLFGGSGITERNKGWDLLEPALHTVAEAVPGARAVIFGSPDVAVIEAEDSNIAMPMHRLGRIGDPGRLAQLYSVCDVMVVPSRMESFSQTASEASACGTPVVAFDASGLRDVVDNGVTGLLVQPYSSDALGAAIVRVITDPSLALTLGLNARERALRLWAPQVVASSYVQWYDEAERR